MIRLMIFFIIHCESETNLFSPFSLNLHRFVSVLLDSRYFKTRIRAVLKLRSLLIAKMMIDDVIMS